MEEKRRDAVALPAAISAAGGAVVTPTRQADAIASEPTSSRRRAGGQKRKANSSNVSLSSSAPSKRLARERLPAFLSSTIHNGPLTRARHTPANLSPSAPPGFSQVLMDPPTPPVDAAGEGGAAGKEARGKNVDMQALESAVDAEFEAIRSRDSKVHVVPIHCGWFSWTKVHPLEEKTLPSFFNGKSESRNLYMEIRNWIMKKYHADPNTQIELKDLSELSAGDLDARQEVMEFLDYWGLINFHPFPPADPKGQEADNGAKMMDASLEELYSFQSVQAGTTLVPKANVVMPFLPPRWLPESIISEELARPEGPAVEYHCNSCSADCSRKRYHCQKQADFDLCTECYSNGKFDSDMAPSDFILMEPAEGPGLSSGKWTDQETLLLLEALELYKENWNEIAEHVATKTKDQCILHFVQMPIEDTFLDCDDEVDANNQDKANTVSANKDPSISKGPPETTPKEDPETTSRDAPETTAEGALEAHDNAPEITLKDAPETTPQEALETTPQEAPKTTPKEAPETDESKTNTSEDQPSSSPMEILKPEYVGEHSAGENYAVTALKEAFEAVNSFPVEESQFSFAEAGNPVMALVAFLVRLVEPDVVTASAHCSLNSISGNSPGMQLAAMHCFLLEDPPEDKKDLVDSDRAAAETIDRDENEETPKILLEGNNLLSDENGKKLEVSVPEEKGSNEDCPGKSHTREPVGVTTNEDVQPNTVKESDNLLPKSELPASPAKESSDNDKLKEAPGCGEDSSKENPQCGEAPKDTDDVSPPSEKIMKEPEESTSNLVVEDVDATNGSKNACRSNGKSKDDHNIDKLKRAAITALSAATVKAKLLAKQEEDQIRQLAASLIDKQLRKVETKLAFFDEMESAVGRYREQLDRSKQKLYQERAQIIASRLGFPASASKSVPQSFQANRSAVNFANLVPRPPMSMPSQRPSRPPIMPSTFPPSNPFVPPAMAGISIRPSAQDKHSPVGMK